MMSEEEEEMNEEDNVCRFRRRRQIWKSVKFCRFIDKLDQRLAKKKSKTINPARERCYGDKLEVIAPGAAKSWMKVQPNETATEHGPTNEVTDQTDNSNIELSDSDDDQDS